MKFTNEIWRTSSRCSADRPMCVAVAVTPEVVGVKDTKNPHSGVLAFGSETWKAFLQDAPSV